MSIFVTCLCVLILSTPGFILGVTWSAFIMVKRRRTLHDLLFDESDEGQRLTAKFQVGIDAAAQCWCDPRTIKTYFDIELATVFAEKIAEYVEALQWCSGASDFQQGGDGVPEGCARVGFDKIVRPLLRS